MSESTRTRPFTPPTTPTHTWVRTLALWLGLTLAVFVAAAPGSAAPDEADQAARGLVQQRALPALEARRQVATARSDAAAAWFAGRETFGAAFPQLAGAALGDPGFLQARAWDLQRLGKDRAAERVRTTPSLGGDLPAAELEAWREALEQACAAEDLADAAELRLLAGLASLLERAPGLSDEAIREQRTGWRSLMTAANGPEATPEAGAQAAAAAQADTALQQLRLAAWRAATVPGDPALEQLVRADLTALSVEGNPDTEELAALRTAARVDRLERALPVLEGAIADEVREAIGVLELAALTAKKGQLGRALAAARTQDGTEAFCDATAASLDELVKARTLHLAQVQQAQSDNVDVVDAEPLSDLQRLQGEVAALRVQLAEAELDQARRGLERAHRQAAVLLPATQDAQVATEARRKAEEAKTRAAQEQDQLSSAENSLRDRVAALRLEVAERVEAEATRRTAAVQTHESLQARLAEQADSLAAALALPPLDPMRGASIDDAYASLRGAVDAIRVERADREQVVRSAEAERHQRLASLERVEASGSNVATSAAIAALVQEAGEARAELEIALVRPVQSLQEESMALGALLLQAKLERRHARAFASRDARRVVNQTWFPELAAELAELPFQVTDSYRRVLRGLGEAPRKLLDLGAIASFLSGSLELIVLLMGWLWARRRVSGWVDQLVRTVESGLHSAESSPLRQTLSELLRPWMDPIDRGKVLPTLHGFSLGLLNLLAAILLTVAIGGGAPLLAWLGWAVLAVTVWRLVPLAHLLVFSTPEDHRPSLRVISADTSALVLRSARLLVGWWLVARLVRSATLSLLQTDRLTELVAVLATLVFWCIVAWLVHRWGPWIITAFSAEAGTGRLAAWIGRQSEGRLMGFLRALLALGGLLTRALQQSSSLLVHRQGRLAWLGALVARRQLRDSEGQPREPLDPAVRQRLQAARKPRPWLDGPVEKLVTRHQAWRSDRRRGAVCLVADRGMGKDEVLDRLTESLPEGRLETLSSDVRIAGVQDALAWLSGALGLGEVEGDMEPAQLAEELAALPGEPRVFVLENLERLFQRSVGGFAALRAALEVVHASSDDHFWIVTMHGPTWNYLRSVPGAFEAAVFGEVIQLEPAAPQQLEQWLEGCAAEAGLTLSYDRLAGTGEGSPAAGRERKRAARAYWRLLYELSAGNPSVAREQWLEGLAPGENPDELETGLASVPTIADLSDLPDADLFVLVALVIHDRLRVANLSRVLNLDQAGVRATCRRLEARSVLWSEEEQDIFGLRLSWTPAVQRLLRQKNFLYTRA